MPFQNMSDASYSQKKDLVYFGDIYVCAACKQAKGISQLDDIERSQSEYIALADGYILATGAEVVHVSRDDWTCRTCLPE